MRARAIGRVIAYVVKGVILLCLITTQPFREVSHYCFLHRPAVSHARQISINRPSHLILGLAARPAAWVRKKKKQPRDPRDASTFRETPRANFPPPRPLVPSPSGSKSIHCFNSSNEITASRAATGRSPRTATLAAVLCFRFVFILPAVVFDSHYGRRLPDYT